MDDAIFICHPSRLACDGSDLRLIALPGAATSRGQIVYDTQTCGSCSCLYARWRKGSLSEEPFAAFNGSSATAHGTPVRHPHNAFGGTSWLVEFVSALVENAHMQQLSSICHVLSDFFRMPFSRWCSSSCCSGDKLMSNLPTYPSCRFLPCIGKYVFYVLPILEQSLVWTRVPQDRSGVRYYQ